jgi:hypothetical protein
MSITKIAQFLKNKSRKQSKAFVKFELELLCTVSLSDCRVFTIGDNDFVLIFPVMAFCS